MQISSNPPLRWRMTPLIGATLALHAALPAALVLAPHAWSWVLAALLGNHLVLTGVGLWPRSTWLGANLTRLPAEAAARREIALTIDDGPDPEVTPQVLAILERYSARATFFCIGEKAARYPDLCREIVRRGHTIENHSQHHRHYFSLMGMQGLAREISAGQQTLAAVTGRTPQFFRAPAGLRNPFLDPVLAKLGLRLASWTRRGYDTRTADPEVVSRRLLQDVRAGAILLLHDSNCARMASGMPVILAVLPNLLEAGARAKLRFVTLSSAFQPSSP
jgi:peptidoglycan/xylan/chitin deacetylase (PgdA/CDA1 family)